MGAKEQWPSAKRIAIQSQLDSRENAELDREADARLYDERCEKLSLLDSILFATPDAKSAEHSANYSLNAVLLSSFPNAEFENVHSNRPVASYGYQSWVDGLAVNEYQHRTVCESVIVRMTRAVEWCKSNGVDALELIDQIYSGTHSEWWIKVCDAWAFCSCSRANEAVELLMQVDAREEIGRVFQAFESAAWEAIQPKPSKVLQNGSASDGLPTEEAPSGMGERSFSNRLPDQDGQTVNGRSPSQSRLPRKADGFPSTSSASDSDSNFGRENGSSSTTDVWAKLLNALCAIHYPNGDWTEEVFRLKQIAEVAGVKPTALQYQFGQKLFPNCEDSAKVKYERAVKSGLLKKLLEVERDSGKSFEARLPENI